MAYIDSTPLDTNILLLYSEKDEIIVNPEYQRNGEIWNESKRQLLIDSIINRYDIPKIYFHKLSKVEQTKTGKKYAIIDGRQRLEAIWGFIDGKFALGSDFEYIRDAKIKAAGFTYDDLGKNYPKLKIQFDAIPLPIVVVETDDPELIEDMFSRLNEAAPLNAAEKRNAFGGPMAKLISEVALHKFFKERVSFSNKRYQHKEAAAKILFLVYTLSSNKGKIIDTKKIYLDDFVKSNKTTSPTKLNVWSKETKSILDEMCKIFIKTDPLLKAQGTFPVYFLLIRDYMVAGKLGKFTRNKLVNFHERLKENRKKAEKNIASAEFELLEFDRLSQQGTNDASSISTRLEILKSHIKV